MQRYKARIEHTFGGLLSSAEILKDKKEADETMDLTERQAAALNKSSAATDNMKNYSDFADLSALSRLKFTVLSDSGLLSMRALLTDSSPTTKTSRKVDLEVHQVKIKAVSFLELQRMFDDDVEVGWWAGTAVIVKNDLGENQVGVMMFMYRHRRVTTNNWYGVVVTDPTPFKCLIVLLNSKHCKPVLPLQKLDLEQWAFIGKQDVKELMFQKHQTNFDPQLPAPVSSGKRVSVKPSFYSPLHTSTRPGKNNPPLLASDGPSSDGDTEGDSGKGKGGAKGNGKDNGKGKGKGGRGARGGRRGRGKGGGKGTGSGKGTRVGKGTSGGKGQGSDKESARDCVLDSATESSCSGDESRCDDESRGGKENRARRGPKRRGEPLEVSRETAVRQLIGDIKDDLKSSITALHSAVQANANANANAISIAIANANSNANSDVLTSGGATIALRLQQPFVELLRLQAEAAAPRPAAGPSVLPAHASTWTATEVQHFLETLGINSDRQREAFRNVRGVLLVEFSVDELAASPYSLTLPEARMLYKQVQKRNASGNQ